MTSFISPNQSGFIKDRLISKNIILAHEIVQSIDHVNQGGNIVLKLDMVKAYDRISWSFIASVLRKFGFSELWIYKIMNILSEIWYSIIVNGNRKGFLSSCQGLKQGDPLSPSLFILAAEVITCSFNLYSNDNFILFSMPQRAPQINHLAFVDDIVIFTSGSIASINLIMDIIRRYESISGQKVNNDKIFFLAAPNTCVTRINRIRNATGYMDKNFPFTYLGCSIYIERKMLVYFDCLVNKIVKKLNGWNSKILAHEGRIILIKHVFQSLHIYTLSAMSPLPPKAFLN